MGLIVGPIFCFKPSLPIWLDRFQNGIRAGANLAEKHLGLGRFSFGMAPAISHL
jgi:hypothetical protein